jgi:hypothetical protein
VEFEEERGTTFFFDDFGVSSVGDVKKCATGTRDVARHAGCGRGRGRGSVVGVCFEDLDLSEVALY